MLLSSEEPVILNSGKVFSILVHSWNCVCKEQFHGYKCHITLLFRCSPKSILIGKTVFVKSYNLTQTIEAFSCLYWFAHSCAYLSFLKHVLDTQEASIHWVKVSLVISYFCCTAHQMCSVKRYRYTLYYIYIYYICTDIFFPALVWILRYKWSIKLILPFKTAEYLRRLTYLLISSFLVSALVGWPRKEMQEFRGWTEVITLAYCQFAHA